MEEILAMAKEVAEEADVFFVSSEEMPVQFEANRLKHIQSKQSTRIALRVVRNGKIGYAAAAGAADARRLVDMAVETSEFGTVSRLELPAFTVFPSVGVFDSDVESMTTGEMIKAGEKLIGTLRQHTPELLCNAWVTRETSSVRIMNSRGGEAKYRQTVSGLSIWANLIRDTDMLFVGDGESSCHPILQSDAVARAVIQQLEFARDRASVSAGSFPVLFTPDGVASALISPLIAAFNGKTVLEGASPVGGKLGQKIFDEKLQIWDDPTSPYRPASRPCDDEGVPSQRTPLINRGVVASFLYDLQTAAQAGARSTGNGGRGRGGLVAPSPSAFVMAPGDVSFDDMVADIKEGLVVEQLMGAEQGNILGGDFSGNVLLGYKVENGKIVGRVKNTMVSGNVYHLLREITGVGREAKWVSSSLCIPALFFSNVS
ncbi:MAG: TldD/PmbA family protein, partial [Chloroflexi bacterium]|nr:TldD/PmbA family protein [Chloroflexota bacterium]